MELTHERMPVCCVFGVTHVAYKAVHTFTLFCTRKKTIRNITQKGVEPSRWRAPPVTGLAASIPHIHNTL